MKSTFSHSWIYAFLSGILGATASCFGKLAFGTGQLDDDTSLVRMFWLILANTACPFISTTETASGSDYKNNNDTNESTTDWSHFLLFFSSLSCYSLVQEIIPRIIWLGLMLSCNVAMLSTFLIALEKTGSVAGTAVSSASNMIMSAVYGYLLFNEKTHDNNNKMWWTGFSMILIGVTLLSSVQIVDHNEPNPTGSSTSTHQHYSHSSSTQLKQKIRKED